MLQNKSAEAWQTSLLKEHGPDHKLVCEIIMLGFGIIVKNSDKLRVLPCKRDMQKKIALWILNSQKCYKFSEQHAKKVSLVICMIYWEFSKFLCGAITTKRHTKYSGVGAFAGIKSRER